MAEKLTGADIAKLYDDADGSTTSATAAPATSAPLTGADISKAFDAADAQPASAATTTAQPSWTDTASDALSYGAGLLSSLKQGLSLGLANPLDRLTAAAFPKSAFARQVAEHEQAQAAFEAAHPVVSTLAQAAGTVPAYAAGEGVLASTVLPTLAGGGVARGAVNLVTSAGRNALVNAGVSAATADGDRADAAKTGAIVGAVAGPAGDLVGRVGNALAGRSGGVDPAVADLARTARDQYNIPVYAPQLAANSSPIRIAADQAARFPGSGAAAADATQRAAFNQAVTRTFGENAERITPDVMDRAATRIGHDFETVAQRTTINADPQFMNDLATIRADAGRLTPDQATTIRGHIDDVMHAVAQGNGVIPGDVYQSLTRATAPLGRATRDQNSNIAYYSQAVREALDDAFQRSASPADQALLQQARGQYRAMRTVEDLVEKSPDGNISPALLMGQVRSANARFNPGTGGMAYTGGGPLGDLARIGQQFLKSQPNSGTADRAWVNAMLTGAGGFGYGTGYLSPYTAAALAGGPLINRGVNTILRSNALSNNLINSSLTPQAMQAYRYSPYVVPLANALASGKVPVQ